MCLLHISTLRTHFFTNFARFVYSFGNHMSEQRLSLLRFSFARKTSARHLSPPFFEKGHARLTCSLASALDAVRCRYQPFSHLHLQRSNVREKVASKKRLRAVSLFICTKNVRIFSFEKRLRGFIFYTAQTA